MAFLSGVRGRRMPTLKELCVDNFQRGDLATVSLSGVPPHLLGEILSAVKSPAELAAIGDRAENARLFGFADAASARWGQFVRAKFWAGKCEPLELPPGESWRSYYAVLDARRRESLEAVARAAPGASAAPKKKSKIVDIADVQRVQRARRLHSAPRAERGNFWRPPPAADGSSRKPDHGTAFMKKWRNRD